uniref:Reverse transcriptase domain-containing protein n=1 Tax=Micrurus lemniscatus lemniscatus TaxID=129467 RepID=A0A2D4H858_MICLE
MKKDMFVMEMRRKNHTITMGNYIIKNIQEEKIKQYLKKAKLPQILKDIEIILEGNIMMMELTEALKRQNVRKVPGPDGLPAEFYKTFQETLNLQLLEVMSEVM